MAAESPTSKLQDHRQQSCVIHNATGDSRERGIIRSSREDERI